MRINQISMMPRTNIQPAKNNAKHKTTSNNQNMSFEGKIRIHHCPGDISTEQFGSLPFNSIDYNYTRYLGICTDDENKTVTIDTDYIAENGFRTGHRPYDQKITMKDPEDYPSLSIGFSDLWDEDFKRLETLYKQVKGTDETVDFYTYGIQKKFDDFEYYSNSPYDFFGRLLRDVENGTLSEYSTDDWKNILKIDPIKINEEREYLLSDLESFDKKDEDGRPLSFATEYSISYDMQSFDNNGGVVNAMLLSTPELLDAVNKMKQPINQINTLLLSRTIEDCKKCECGIPFNVISDIESLINKEPSYKETAHKILDNIKDNISDDYKESSYSILSPNDFRKITEFANEIGYPNTEGLISSICQNRYNHMNWILHGYLQ